MQNVLRPDTLANVNVRTAMWETQLEIKAVAFAKYRVQVEVIVQRITTATEEFAKV